MSIRAESLSPEEIATRGSQIYEQAIRSQVEKDHRGEVLAIDILSGDHAVAGSPLAAADLLRQKRPGAVVWLMRIGYPSLYKIGRPRRSGRT